MTILVFTTSDTRCDLSAVLELVNALQYFFVARNGGTTVTFPKELVAEPLISLPQVTTFVRSDVLDPKGTAADLYILITSALLPIPRDGSVFIDGNVAVISNHLWLAKEMPETFRFARHILQLGMSRLLRHSSAVTSCIGGPQEGFDCICQDCEVQLARTGYRDGINRLKESFNVLNQLQSGGSAEMLKVPSDLMAGELRLARDYVLEYAQEGVSVRNHVVLIVLHFLSDLVPFVRALHSLGVCYADIYLVAKPYPYARRDEVTHVLETLGVNVTRAFKGNSVENCAKAVLTDLSSREPSGDSPVLVIEDGGYFAPLLHTAEFSRLLGSCVGIVEQTQKGAAEDKKITNLSVPVLSVAESTFKKVYESPEIGRVAVQNISRFTPNVKLSGRHAVVFGFGSVGQEVAAHLTNGFNMTVSVVDPKLDALLRARHRRSIVAEAQRSFQELKFRCPALMVGTTGTTSITKEVLQQLTEGTVAVSTSSDQVEIDLVALTELARGRVCEIVEGKSVFTIGGDEKPVDITLLAEGYPINFYGSESLPNDTIDPIMTLLLLCAVELTLSDKWKHTVDPHVVGEIVERRQLVQKFLEYA